MEPSPTHIHWDTTQWPVYEYGAMLGAALLMAGIAVSYLHGRKLGGSLTSAWRFHRWSNLAILIALLNGCAMAAISMNVFLFTDANTEAFAADPMPYLPTLKSDNAVQIGCICLFGEGVLTALVCGLAFKLVAPWDAAGGAWQEFLKRERWHIIVLQIWWGLTFFAAWIARFILIGMYRHYQGTNLPSGIKKQLLGEMVTACVDTAFILWWCAASTWCRRTEYTAYTCPACDGDRGCEDCVNGLQYHSA